MKVHNGTCHNPTDTAPVDIWPSHGALAVPENEQMLVYVKTYLPFFHNCNNVCTWNLNPEATNDI
jgi:hypothetical protein